MMRNLRALRLPQRFQFGQSTTKRTLPARSVKRHHGREVVVQRRYLSSSSSNNSTFVRTLSSVASARRDDDGAAGSLFLSSSTTLSQEDIDALIEERTHEQVTPVCIRDLMRTGQGDYLDQTFGEQTRQRCPVSELVSLQMAQFLRRELPIRLAHVLRDMDSIEVLRDMPSVVVVRELYQTSFVELQHLPDEITTPETEQQFANALEVLYQRHASILVQMAKGAYEFRSFERKKLKEGQSDAIDFCAHEETHAFLDRFYLRRIGIRILIGQYLALRHPPMENYVGIICTRTSPYEVIKRSIDDAAFMCYRKYGDVPDVIMSGQLDLTFPFVPMHLHYIMLELLKNSMRATVEWQGLESDFSPIQVTVEGNDDNVVIKMSDQGGGIPKCNMDKIWSYLFTTADPSIQESMVGKGSSSGSTDHSIDAPLAGLGYGLPISRSYCRYFRGDMTVESREGEGTNASVFLTRLGT